MIAGATCRSTAYEYHFGMKTKMRAKPFVKWAGGKQGLAETLVTYFPTPIRKFYEPFIGGGSVLFTMTPDAAVVGDQNEWLLETYAAIRDDWKKVAAILDTLPNTRTDFLRIRSVRPESLDLFARAAHFIYLNKTCFRGLFRVNRQGGFNVPYGEYQRAYYDPKNLQAAAKALSHVEIRSTDFELTLHDVTKEDFVYLDPPYFKLGGYSDFNRYTRFQFHANDHMRLAAVCREMNDRGIRWAVSNSDTPFVRSLFDGFEIIEIENRREINLNSQSRDITELLIINYPKPPKRDFPLFNE